MLVELGERRKARRPDFNWKETRNHLAFIKKLGWVISGPPPGRSFKADQVLSCWPAYFNELGEAHLRSGNKVGHRTCDVRMLFLNLRMSSLNHREELPGVENGLLFLRLIWDLALSLASRLPLLSTGLPSRPGVATWMNLST